MLNCGPGTPGSTEIFFATTERTTFTLAVPDDACGQNYPWPLINPCTQIVAQSAQGTYEYPQGMWQPPLAVRIVGQGSGYMPAPMSLPLVLPSCGGSSCGTNYLQVHNAEADGSSWDTALNAQCQMYIYNWTDTSISVAVNLPIDAFNAIDPNVLRLSPT